MAAGGGQSGSQSGGQSGGKSGGQNGGQSGGHRLLKAADAPAYVREDSIETGYRQSLSYQGCLKR